MTVAEYRPEHHQDEGPAFYPRLLAQAGKQPDQLRQLLPQPKAPDAATGALSLSQILEKPDAFADLLAGIARLRGGDVRSLASVLHQNLALQVLGPCTVTLFLDGHTRLPAADAIWLDTADPEGQWYLAPDTGADTVDEACYIREMATLSRQWYEVFRRQLGVSAGAYWSSTGLALCAPYSALYDSARPQELCHQASHWLQRFDCDARRFIDWIPFTFGELDCAIPQRRGCCQKYRLPDGGYCGTCGIYRKERLALVASQSPEGAVD
ncbi:(2Fe-2S)-binding protein [Marinobacter sp. CA1]|uniref:(2Fe-2S)-binding protein n=1 Tax=Marinobacter sp. CA1 TaxID=2817656 RepID=UPI001D08338E|nr:(2Fe-2S)-binding protein [Marinobacter sp. CA1]UDL04069.1 (2Fe-2S)-binding protein [Marinobacter sp. CA1]